MKTIMLTKSLIKETTHNGDFNINSFKKSMIKQKFANDVINKNKEKYKQILIKGYKNQNKTK